MTGVAEIKQAILELNETDYVELRRWFSELDWESGMKNLKRMWQPVGWIF